MLYQRAAWQYVKADSLVAQLLNMEHATFRSDVSGSQVIDSVDNCSSNGTGNTVVVRFPDTADSGDRRVCLEEVMLGKI
jgi:hypothetical protein